MTQTFTEQQISAVHAELRRQARGGELDGINWNPLRAIAGEDAFRVMDILEARGAISHRILPGCFSHQVWRV